MIIVVQRPPISRSRVGEAKFKKDMVAHLISEKDKIPDFHTLGECDVDVHFHVPDEKFVLGLDNRNAEPTLEVARDALVEAGIKANHHYTGVRVMDVVKNSTIAPAVVFEVAASCECCSIYIGPDHIEQAMYFVGGHCICGYCNIGLRKHGFLNLSRPRQRLWVDGRVEPLSMWAHATESDEGEDKPKPKPKVKVKRDGAKPMDYGITRELLYWILQDVCKAALIVKREAEGHEGGVKQ